MCREEGASRTVLSDKINRVTTLIQSKIEEEG